MSKHYRPNPLLDSITDLDFTLFTVMKLSDVECWEQIEIQAAICGIEVDKNLVKFLIVMAYHADNILDIIATAIKNKQIIELFDDEIEAIETIYKLLDYRVMNSEQMFKAISEYVIKSNDIVFNKYNYCEPPFPDKLNKQKLKLLTAIETKYPLILVKFYDKWKRILHQQDMAFVRFMKNKLFSRAKTDRRFNGIAAAVEAEFNRQQNVSMFML